MKKGTEGGVILGLAIFFLIVFALVSGGDKGNSHSGSSYRSNSSTRYTGSSYSTTRSAATTSTSSSTGTASRSSGYSSGTRSSATSRHSSGTTTSTTNHLDPDDMDVDGFYYDNRGDFENEDDAWDYLEDEPDDWD